jgi:hypothetical protein
MLRSTGTLLFIIFYLYGYFQNIPYLVLILLIVISFLEDTTIYMIYYNKNHSPFWNQIDKMSRVFFAKDTPDFKKAPVLFSIDRLGYAIFMLYLIYYIFTQYPIPFSFPFSFPF